MPQGELIVQLAALLREGTAEYFAFILLSGNVA
jgi:hypothetical protein